LEKVKRSSEYEETGDEHILLEPYEELFMKVMKHEVN